MSFRTQQCDISLVGSPHWWYCRVDETKAIALLSKLKMTEVVKSNNKRRYVAVILSIVKRVNA